MRVSVFAFGIALLSASVAHAGESCALKQVGSLPVTFAPNGDAAIPVTVGGAEHRFILGLNQPYSAIRGSFADQNAFTTKSLPEALKPTVSGEAITKSVKVPDVLVGNMHGTDFQMFRYESEVGGGGGIVGLLGLDFLSNIDVELDLHNKKLNLFSQDHCKGSVVYWAKESAILPFTSDKSGHFIVTMQLDGKPVGVDFDVSQGHGYMSGEAAKRIFNIDAQSPGAQAIQEPPGTPVFFRYPFKSLAIQGVAIANPEIHIAADAGQCRNTTTWKGFRPTKCYGEADLRLRIQELSALRLYVAFKEKTLYVTAADAHL